MRERFSPACRFEKIAGNAGGTSQSLFCREIFRFRLNLSRYPRPLLLIPYAGFSADAPAGSRGNTPTSAHILAAIVAGVPAYVPPAPSPAATPGPGSTEDIVFLPKVVVHGSKVPDGSEWQMLSAQGKAEYLKKLYPGFVVPGRDPLDESVPNYAAQMHRDDVRKENLRAMEDAVNFCRSTGDLKRSKVLKKEMQRALIHGYDWRTERLDRSYNNDRR